MVVNTQMSMAQISMKKIQNKRTIVTWVFITLLPGELKPELEGTEKEK